MEKRYIQIETTFSNFKEAERLAGLIVDAGLAACGQLSEINSVYNFEGKRFNEREILLTLKTRAELFLECERFIKKHHPYKVPQIVATEILAGSAEYLAWIDENLKK